MVLIRLSSRGESNKMYLDCSLFHHVDGRSSHDFNFNKHAFTDDASTRLSTEGIKLELGRAWL